MELLKYLRYGTGKLIICYPDYLSDWIDNKVESKREYKDVKTDKVYVFGKDFNKYDERLLDEKSVNQLIDEKRLIRLPYEETSEFSNKSVTQGIINKGFSQCNFKDNRKGLAFAMATLLGDGEYPIFAEFQEERISKIWIDFSINLDELTEENKIESTQKLIVNGR